LRAPPLPAFQVAAFACTEALSIKFLGIFVSTGYRKERDDPTFPKPVQTVGRALDPFGIDTGIRRWKDDGATAS